MCELQARQLPITMHVIHNVYYNVIIIIPTLLVYMCCYSNNNIIIIIIMNNNYVHVQQHRQLPLTHVGSSSFVLFFFLSVCVFYSV